MDRNTWKALDLAQEIVTLWHSLNVVTRDENGDPDTTEDFENAVENLGAALKQVHTGVEGSATEERRAARDQFASAFINGQSRRDRGDWLSLIEDAWAFADAMLAERDKQGGQ